MRVKSSIFTLKPAIDQFISRREDGFREIRKQFLEKIAGLETVPPELKHALGDSSNLLTCITDNHTTLERLIEIHQQAPWVISALRFSHIHEGIEQQFISIEQLMLLTQEQVKSLHSNYQGDALKSRVETLIADNHEPSETPSKRLRITF